ncbi:MAG: hypothetical protein MUE94_00995 [Verrucomicrobia bacterium]|jgi:hypothetical protein|nr:hypothetical protein [Verrucomicrobiota bacterium]
MNTLRILLLALLPGLASTAHAAQTAQARLCSWSLRFSGASANGGGGFTYTLDLTTIGSGLNGELAIDTDQTGYSHYSSVDLYEEYWLEGTFQGFLAVDVPDAGDANGNGFPDFFEVSQPVNGLATTGFLQVPGIAYLGDVQATWSRNAGSAQGTCVLTVPDPANPFVDLNFFHSFELLEYQGVLTYTPGTTNVAGTLSVTNTALTDTLRGPLQFAKSTTNPTNELTLWSASLTNALAQGIGLYTNTMFFREAAYPTNYFGNVEFLDGDLNTLEADYYTWQLSLDDLNDADGDGIPDFSDAPALPRRPLLSLTRGATNLWLTLRGDVGWTNQIQTVTNLTSTNWLTVLTLKQTNDPQTVSLPLPSGRTFWRAWISAGP